MRINPASLHEDTSSTGSNELVGLPLLEPIWQHWTQSAPDIEEFQRRFIAMDRMIDCERNRREFLSLSHLGLSDLPEHLPASAELQRIQLEGNRLTRFPEALLGLPSLKLADLCDNPLTAAPPDLGSQLPKDLKVLLHRGAMPPPRALIDCFNADHLRVIHGRVIHRVTPELLQSLEATPPASRDPQPSPRDRDYYLYLQPPNPGAGRARRALDFSTGA